MTTCSKHTDTRADGICFHCGKSICIACTSTRSVETACHACFEERAAQRRRGQVFKGALMTAIAAAAVVGIVAGVHAYTPAFDYGSHRYEVRRLEDVLAKSPCDTGALASLLEEMNAAGDTQGVASRASAFQAKCGKLPWTPWLTTDYGDQLVFVKKLAEALEKEPCDRQRLIELLEVMIKANDARGVLSRADMFFGACGDFPRARWLTFEAHKRLSEFDLAAAEASKLIDAERFDRDYWWWRGDAYFLKGDFEKALADYKEVRKLCPECLVGWAYADAAEKSGHPCEGVEALQQTLDRHPDLRNYDEVERRIAATKARPECAVPGRAPSAAAHR